MKMFKIEKPMKLHFLSVQVILLIIIISACNSQQSEKIGKSTDLTTILPENAAFEKLTVGYTFDTAGSPLYMNGEL